MIYDPKTKTWRYHGVIYLTLLAGLQANDPRKA